MMPELEHNSAQKHFVKRFLEIYEFFGGAEPRRGVTSCSAVIAVAVQVVSLGRASHPQYSADYGVLQSAIRGAQ